MNSHCFAVAVLMTVFYGFVAAAEDGLSEEQWREDLQFLRETIDTKHKNAYHRVSREALEGAIAALEARVPELEDYEIVLEITRIVAMIGDGHSQARHSADAGLRKYPIALRLFSDGVFAVECGEGHERAMSARLVRVGTGTSEAIVEAIKPFVPRDNEWSLKSRMPWYFVTPELLHYLGFVEDMEAAVFEFEDADGTVFEETFSPVSIGKYRYWRETWKPPADVPLYRGTPELDYWTKLLPDDNTVYARFNRVINRPRVAHIAGFSKDMIKLIDDSKADFLIVDVRNNGGGNGDLLESLIRRIERHERINRDGHLYVITNRKTFSAAMMFVTRMQRRTNVLFAGEPAGGKPNHYGDAYPAYALPNSKVEVVFSTRYHEESVPGDERPYQEVDLPVAMSSRDYFENRDPVLEAVLEAIRKVKD